VKQLLESVPAAIKQDAIRGQALVLKQQGDTAAAEALLADILQSEEQFAQLQYLAQADYGTLLHEQGNPKVCRLSRGVNCDGSWVPCLHA